MGRVKHGLSAYAAGECRCRRCRAAWAAYHKLRRRKARAGAVGRPGPAPAAPSKTVYAGKEQLAVQLTPLAQQIVLARAARRHRGFDDALEEIVRAGALAAAV